MLNKFSELIGLLSKANGISTSQIRKFLDALRKIKTSISKDEFNPSEVLLLQVKVAYTAGRNRNLNFFYDVMKPAIEYGSRDKFHFEQLLRFVEAIVAYHRFYKGEN
jgi:CRISPR-associated protein Csm2